MAENTTTTAIPNYDDASQTVVVYLLPGMAAKFEIVFDPYNNKGSDPMGGVAGKYADYTLKNGFVSLNPAVGDIAPVTDEVAVIYNHYKAENNTVMFYSEDSNVKVAFQVTAVPIHDHSSIVQGGPALGTYFVDSEED